MARQGRVFYAGHPSFGTGIGVTAAQLSAFMTNHRVDWVQEVAGPSIATNPHRHLVDELSSHRSGGRKRLHVIAQMNSSLTGMATMKDSNKGKELMGLEYEPLFDYFKGKAREEAWQIVSDGYVSTEAGTCIVHQAPAFGEDDNRVCTGAGIILKDGTGMVCPIDDDGRFTDEVPDFKGKHVKEADKDIKVATSGVSRFVSGIWGSLWGSSMAE
ncbi:ileS [Symbiodinium sp. CCMP2592]|nr:ileS [Symbiodinium sp. CCMP2592]